MDLYVDPVYLPDHRLANTTGKKFGIRLLAYLIDYFIILVVNVVAAFVAGIAFFIVLSLVLLLLGGDYVLDDNSTRLRDFLVGLTLLILYFSLFEWRYMASPGKWLLRLRVVNYQGGRCSFSQALTRAAWRLIDGLFFGLIAYSHMKPPLNQRLGDARAKTLVVGADEPLISERPSFANFVLAAVLYALIAGSLQVVALLPDLKIFW
jgi:uncharacterized RDD family membrane protein YckC